MQQPVQSGRNPHSSPHSSPSSHMQSSVGASVSGGVGSASGSHVSPAPSKVLHIRGLPPYTSESDVLSFFASLPAQAGGSAGGSSLTRILLLPNSNQAFLQLASVEQAINLVALQAAQGGHFVLKGNKSIIVQFSNRQEIHTPATLAAAAGGGAGAGAGGPAQAQHAHADYAKTGGVGGGNDSQQTANSILIVTVLNTRVPVTLDHIHQIFKPYGDVLKIITFHKNGVFKALVQLSSVDSAINARAMLEGKDIFQGCCHLRIGFSSLHELHVKAPGSNARDFTSPSGASQTFGTEGGGAGYNPQQQSGLIHNGGGGGGGYSSHNGANSSGYDSYASQHSSSQSSHSQQGGPSSAPSHPHSPGCVVLVSNLPDVRVSCDVLFTLFGVYGDVQRVKILYNKRDTALIQFMSAQSAYLAALHLNQLVLYGKQISVTPSKHIEVSLPKSVHNGGTQAEQEQHASGLTQDYTHSPIHRFKRSAGAAGTGAAGGGLGIHAKSIHPPRPVLHVSSLADAVREDEIRQLFSTPSLLVSVWNVERDVAESMRPVTLRVCTWAELESGVRQTFADLLNDKNRSLFALYYIVDPDEPVVSRKKVGNQQQLETHMRWRSTCGLDTGMQLFFHVSNSFQGGKPRSPEKPPLFINTALARASGGIAQDGPDSAHPVSPCSADSQGSRAMPRQKEFRQMVLARDSDHHLRPEHAIKIRPPLLYRCVFCKKLLPALDHLIQACHVIPHSEKKRLGKEVSMEHMLAVGGFLECILNGVSLCALCHVTFDSGLMWVDVEQDGALRIFVHEDWRDVPDFQPKHGQLVQRTDPRFAFPAAVAWQWHKEWAAIKRNCATDSELAQSMDDASLQDSRNTLVPCDCKKGFRDRACVRLTCKSCCLETKTKVVCKASGHRAEGTPTSASSSSSAAQPSAH